MIVTIDDVRKIARYFLGLLEGADGGDRSSVSFRVSCSDGSYYSSATLDVFDLDSPVLLRRPESIEMQFYSYPTSLTAGLDLRHGGSDLSNRFRVSGNDSNWVNGVHRRGQEIISSLRRQNTLVRRFAAPIVLVLPISCGIVMAYMLAAILSLLGGPPKPNPTDAAAPSLWTYVLALPLITALGAIPGSVVYDKLSSLWPRIELQIAPEHQWLERRQRLWLCTAFLVVTAPALKELGAHLLKLLGVK